MADHVVSLIRSNIALAFHVPRRLTVVINIFVSIDLSYVTMVDHQFPTAEMELSI